MKKVFYFTLFTTFCFSQSEDWIYTSLTDESLGQPPSAPWDYSSAYMISPDGENIELIIHDAQFSDISADQSKILLSSNPSYGPIYLYENGSIDTLDLNGTYPRFTAEENVIVYYSPGDENDCPELNSLYKYSITEDLVTQISDSLMECSPPVFVSPCSCLPLFILSPDKEKMMFYRYTSQNDSIDIMIADIETAETVKLRKIENLISHRHNVSYWGQDDYLYMTLGDQLFKVNSTNGDEAPIQLTFFETSSTLLGTNDSYLEQLAISVYNESSGMNPYEFWFYNLTTGDISYYHNYEYTGNIPIQQTWSPDHSKLAIGSLGSTPWGLFPGGITIFNLETGADTAIIEHDGAFIGFMTFHNNLWVEVSSENDISQVFYNEDWNLVGLPLDVEDSGYSILYPESIEGTLFSFSGAYNPATNLINGEGYWLRFNESGSTTIYGTPIYELTISLNEGWNLISGISPTFDISDIQDPDGIIITGTIYGFASGGYSNAEILEPGKGYWIRTNSSGSIILIDN